MERGRKKWRVRGLEGERERDRGGRERERERERGGPCPRREKGRQKKIVHACLLT